MGKNHELTLDQCLLWSRIEGRLKQAAEARVRLAERDYQRVTVGWLNFWGEVQRVAEHGRTDHSREWKNPIRVWFTNPQAPLPPTPKLW